MYNKILIVDDSQTDIIMIKHILQDYNLLVANDGVEAMQIVGEDPDIDIMILDLNMPNMNGFQVLEALRENPLLSKIAVLILTNYDETENEVRGLDLGALDYIRKPLNLASLRKRIEVHVNLRNARHELENSNIMLEKMVEERTKELVLTRDITIHALIGLLEIRDIESSNHTRRTQWMMKALCEHLRNREPYRQILTDSYVRELFSTAPLHDIGKVGIPDNILLKPGRLSPEEFEIMKKHVTYGVDALRYDIESANRSVSFIHTAMEIVEGHHEKYDGTGYPKGLQREEIPLPGRLMAIIDVYDALWGKRVYKEAYGHEEALRIIKSDSGKHFDPAIVNAFSEIEEEIKAITMRYNQNESEGE